MKTPTDDDNDPETVAIVSKIKGAEGDGEEKTEGEGDAAEEAKNAAAEDLFQAIRGRAPNESERSDTRAALDAYHKACGY
jgi:hypothetical protein